MGEYNYSETLNGLSAEKYSTIITGNSMLSQAVQDAINAQINSEFCSSYSYLGMSVYCEQDQFLGCAKWLRLQSQEENSHAMRLYDFMIARGGKIVLQDIVAPPTDFDSIPDVFNRAQEQEQQVTEQIDSLYELAFKEKAFSALVELEWFIQEQVEEEKTAREIVHKFNLLKDDPASLVELDRILGERSNAEVA
ncbi:MAG: ferritin [Blastopirellula sp.]|nr:MAG: ferritin [Blastopirellula sp.]